MNNTYIILGYGVPKNIKTDQNYQIYLNTVINKIFELSQQRKDSSPTIICTGGRTDMFKPYLRTESAEIAKQLKRLFKKKTLKEITRGWKIIEERNSVSLLENMIFTKELIEETRIQSEAIVIFCEYTRKTRTEKVAEIVFKTVKNRAIIPIDFDISANRYRKKEQLNKKEKKALEHDLWALKSSENMKEHHKLYKERLAFLRKAGSDNQQEALNDWWKIKNKELNI